MAELFPYQIEAARFLARTPRGGLFDEMGLGKTASSIRALDLVGAKRVLCIVPASVRSNWLRELRMWQGTFRHILVGKTLTDWHAWRRGRFDVLIISYEHATRWLPKIFESPDFFDVCILDEAHYLKNPEAKRTKAILGDLCDGRSGAGFARHVWFLTGTPVPNDPVDIWPFMRFTGRTTAPQSAWVRTHMYSRPTTYGSRQSVNPESAYELRRKLREVSIGRTKADVGVQLPPIFVQEQLVDGDTKEVLSLLREHPDLEDVIKQAVDQGGLHALEHPQMPTLRRLIGQGKAVPYARQLVDELAGTDRKRVVILWHRGAMDLLLNELGKANVKAVMLRGGMTDRDKQAAVDQFQNDPATRVFIGQSIAAGVGITLTAAHEIDMMESAWTPAANAQALMRVHRIGQSMPVTARFITLANSIDEVVNVTVADKVSEIVQVDQRPMVAAPRQET